MSHCGTSSVAWVASSCCVAWVWRSWMYRQVSLGFAVGLAVCRMGDSKGRSSVAKSPDVQLCKMKGVLHCCDAKPVPVGRWRKRSIHLGQYLINILLYIIRYAKTNAEINLNSTLVNRNVALQANKLEHLRPETNGRCDEGGLVGVNERRIPDQVDFVRLQPLAPLDELPECE